MRETNRNNSARDSDVTIAYGFLSALKGDTMEAL